MPDLQALAQEALRRAKLFGAGAAEDFSQQADRGLDTDLMSTIMRGMSSPVGGDSPQIEQSVSSGLGAAGVPGGRERGLAFDLPLGLGEFSLGPREGLGLIAGMAVPGGPEGKAEKIASQAGRNIARTFAERAARFAAQKAENKTAWAGKELATEAVPEVEKAVEAPAKKMYSQMSRAEVEAADKEARAAVRGETTEAASGMTPEQAQEIRDRVTKKWTEDYANLTDEDISQLEESRRVLGLPEPDYGTGTKPKGSYENPMNQEEATAWVKENETPPVTGARPAPGPRSFSNAGENGFPAGDQPVVLKDGTVVGSGYSRVIHGGRGDYVELLPEHVDRNSLTSKYGDPNRPLPERAFYRWMEAGPNKTKVYEQAKGVGYADYKPGRYYIDPADLQGFDGAPPTKPPPTAVPAAAPEPGGKKFYTGVGSRDTPPDVQSLMTRIAAKLNEQGFTLRSGAAEAADTAFETGAGGNHEIYLPWKSFGKRDTSKPGYIWNQHPDASTIAETHYNEKPDGPRWNQLKDTTKKLMSRNTHQVLGQDLNTPSKFVLAWTPGGQGGGGTGQAIRVARARGIQVLDLGDPEVMARMQRFVGEGGEEAVSAPPPVTSATPVADTPAPIDSIPADALVSRRPRFRAGMNFAYNGAQREGVKSKNTFEAIKNGERTSTTRFDSWRGSEKWADAKPGDIVEFTGPSEGERIRVRVTGKNRIDLGKASPAELEDWSKAEGWSVDSAANHAKNGPGWQIHFEYIGSPDLPKTDPGLRPNAQVIKNQMAKAMDLPIVERPKDVWLGGPDRFPRPEDWEASQAGPRVPPRAERTAPVEGPLRPNIPPATELTDLPPGEGIEATKQDIADRAYRAGLDRNTDVLVNPETGEIESIPKGRADLTVEERAEEAPRRKDDESPFAQATTHITGRDYPTDERGRLIEGPPEVAPIAPVKGETSEASGLNEAQELVGKARTNQRTLPPTDTLEGARYHEANRVRAQQFFDDELARVGGDARKSNWYTEILDNMALSSSDKHKALYRQAEDGELGHLRTSRYKKPEMTPGWQETPEGKQYLRGVALDILQRNGETRGMSEQQIAERMVQDKANTMANKANADNPEAANPKRRPKVPKDEAARQEEFQQYAADDAMTRSGQATDEEIAAISTEGKGDAFERDAERPGYTGSGDVSTQDAGGRNYSKAPPAFDVDQATNAREYQQLVQQIERDRKYLDELGKMHDQRKGYTSSYENDEGKTVKKTKVFSEEETAQQIKVAQLRIQRAEKNLAALDKPNFDPETGELLQDAPPTPITRPRISNTTGKPLSKTFESGEETVDPGLIEERKSRPALGGYKADKQTAVNPFKEKQLKAFVDRYLALVDQGQLPVEGPPKPSDTQLYGRATRPAPDPILDLIRQVRGAGAQGSAAPPIPNLRLQEMLRSIGLAA